MVNKNKHPLQFDAVVDAPFGAVGISAQGMQVFIELLPEAYQPKSSEHETIKLLAGHLAAYFADAHHHLNIPVALKGTPFQRRVWQVIASIPTGQVLTYGKIANKIGSGPRAVANACGANYLPLVIPCHRVVAQNGLGGFMRNMPNGQKIKKWLLKHEGVRV